MRTFARNPGVVQQKTAAKSSLSGRTHLGQSREVASIHHLQCNLRNQTAQRMLEDNAEESVALSASTSASPLTHDFSRIPIYSKARTTVEPNLTVDTPGDGYEQEADRVANHVMRMPDPLLQRACACGGQCPQCVEDEQLQGKPHTSMATPMIPPQHEDREGDFPRGKNTSTFTPTVTPRVSASINAMRGGGQPLSPSVRTFFEPRFGADFSNVRVHCDSRAAEAAGALNAKAFTVGNSIAFGPGHYSPMSNRGRWLLAHELTHTLQQGEVQVRRVRETFVGDNVPQELGGGGCRKITESPCPGVTGQFEQIESFPSMTLTNVGDSDLVVGDWFLENGKPRGFKGITTLGPGESITHTKREDADGVGFRCEDYVEEGVARLEHPYSCV